MIGKKKNVNFEAPDRLNRFVEGTKLIGELLTESSIRIDGEIQGNVNCAGKVLIGESALIKGNLICNEAEIEGTVEGDLKIDTLLVLREKARISGNINTAKIEVHQGAVFTGNCVMSGGTNTNSKSAPIKATKEQPEDIVY